MRPRRASRCPAGAQLIVDTQRLYHAVWHQGDEPRYCLITSWESGPELESYIAKYHGRSYVESYPLTRRGARRGRARSPPRSAAARAAALAARGQDPHVRRRHPARCSSRPWAAWRWSSSPRRELADGGPGCLERGRSALT